MTLRVLHLVGSPVSEFHCRLSRLYAADCLTALADPARYTVLLAYVSPDGRWRFPLDLGPQALAAAPPMPLAAAVELLATLALDVVVPQMFCLPGMTTYRALFELLGIPYLGNTPAVMALTADKAKARAVVAAAGVDVPPGLVVGPGSRPTMLPVVVKPVDNDNSLGVTLVRDLADYDPAVRRAAAASTTQTALVERYIELGREVRCGVLEQHGRLVCLPLEEYDVDEGRKPIRGHDDKLAASAEGDLRLVAKTQDRAWIVDVADPLTQRVWDAARTCHVALGCRQYSLFDFRIDPDGRPWFLEAGLYCSFAGTSVLTVMAQAAGIALPDLCDLVLTGALGLAEQQHSA